MIPTFRLLILPAVFAACLAAAPIRPGEVVITARFGPQVHVYGVLQQTIAAGTPHYGVVFGQGGNLFLAAGNNGVLRYDNAGNFLGTFGSEFAGPVTDLDFDAAGNAYMAGIVDASTSWIAKFNPAGVKLDEDIFPAEEGQVFVELSADATRLFNVSPRGPVRVFDVGTFTHLPSIPGTFDAEGDIRMLPDGGLLYGSVSGVKRLNAAYAPVQTYDILGSEPWFGVDLANDMTSFWAVEGFGRVRRFDLATGAILESYTAGLGSPYSNLAVAPVPEPASALLVLIGVAVLAARRRRG
jgi:hypothetical protein